MPNERSGTDLQIMLSLLRQITFSWHNLYHKMSTSIKLFLLQFLFRSSPVHFWKNVRKFCRETASGISMKLHMYAHG